MKRTLIAAIMATAAIAFSCAEREEPSDLNGDSLVSDPIATIEDFILDGTTTKTSLSIGDNKVLFAFNNDDVLRVYPGSSPYGTRFYVEENKGTSCIFKATGFKLVEGETYAAFYPGTSIDYLQNAIKVDFTGQVQGEIGAADFLYAAAIKPVNGACRFSMKHLGALMLMDVTFEKAGTFKELSLTSSNTPFFTAGTVDLTADPIAVTGTTTSNTITLALGGADGMSVAAGQTVTFYMMIAPVDMSSNTITMELKNGDDVISSEFVGKNYVPGKAYMVSADPGEPLGEPIDLSAEETANSYIVSAEGYYSINATVAGNGKAVAWEKASFASHAYPEYNTSTLTGNGVAVILNQNNCVSNVSYKDGKILFKATGNEGNAKLTLLNSGVGVWTWHIWCTDAPAALAFYVDDADMIYNIMDRNMGALSNGSDSATCEEVSGLYYQYGNPIGYTYEDFYNQGYQGYEFNGRGIATQQYALALNPNKPILNVTPGEGQDFYWFDLWYDGVPDKIVYSLLWGGGSDIDGSLKYGDEVVKTLYDPCPAGYKIMGWDTFEALSTNTTFSGTANGLFIPAEDSDIFFPYNGAAWPDAKNGEAFYMCRGPYDGSDGAKYATLWLSGHVGRNMAYFNTFYAKSASTGAYQRSPSSGHIVARGFGVRCMADEFDYE